MPTVAQLLVPWAAPVTAECGRGGVDAHAPHSCQFPCWDPSRACFPPQGQTRLSTGLRSQSPGWRQREREGSLQPLQTSLTTSRPRSLPCPESGSPKNGVGTLSCKCPSLGRKSQAGPSRQSWSAAQHRGRSRNRPRAAALPEGGSGALSDRGPQPPQGTGWAASRWLCGSPRGSLSPTKHSLQ